MVDLLTRLFARQLSPGGPDTSLMHAPQLQPPSSRPAHARSFNTVLPHRVSRGTARIGTRHKPAARRGVAPCGHRNSGQPSAGAAYALHDTVLSCSVLVLHRPAASVATCCRVCGGRPATSSPAGAITVRGPVQVSDEGGGIPRSGVARIWTYMYSTAKVPLPDMEEVANTQPTVLAGYGYGLPLSRLYARYFGGDLQVISMEGYGTDAYVHLNRLGDSHEPLP